MAELLSLASDKLLESRKRQEEKKEDGGDESSDVALKPLESAALCSILEIAALQLYIIDVGTCSSPSSNHTNEAVRRKIRDVVEATHHHLWDAGTFDVLRDKVREEAEVRRNEKNVRRLLLENRRRIDDLKLTLRGHEFSKLTEMNQKQEMIASLKDKIHDEITRNHIRLRYADKWETSRRNQNRLKCQDAETEMVRCLDEVASESANEVRVHDAMTALFEEEDRVLKGNINAWKDRYEEEMVKRGERMKLLQTKRKEQQILLRDLSQLERSKEIDDYLAFKAKIRQEEEQNRRINQMATCIQAWWRGTMVRKGLGGFKRKKKSMKDKKKK